MIRLCDVVLSVLGLVMCLPVILVVLIVGLFDTGSPLFFQKRVGRHKKGFTLIKFRTMKVDTPSVASHLANATAITKFGNFLRVSKLDELPQLLNVLKGDMSLVGPRPCLSNQSDLIHEREKRGVFEVRPGITGLAQINEIDMSTPRLLSEVDQEMIASLGFINYLKYICLTALGKGRGDRVRS